MNLIQLLETYLAAPGQAWNWNERRLIEMARSELREKEREANAVRAAALSVPGDGQAVFETADGLKCVAPIPHGAGVRDVRRLVRAVSEVRKWQTRRIINPQPRVVHGWNGDYLETNQLFRDRPGSACPYGKVGDLLCVREAWATSLDLNSFKPSAVPTCSPIWYRAGGMTIREGGSVPLSFTGCVLDHVKPGKWRPSIFMPRWASRFTLEITRVRVQRVQDISNPDARAEGVELLNGWNLGARHTIKGHRTVHATPRHAFESIWNSINQARGFGWDANPWVWVVDFKLVGASRGLESDQVAKAV